MKNFLKVLRRFVPPYKKYLVANIVFNILSAIFNVFTFTLIIPILDIIFKIDDKTYSYMEWSAGGIFSAEWWQSAPEIIQNNFFWYINHITETQGGSFTLIALGIGLATMTLFKVLTMYLAFATMIPIRTGVVRDIRNMIDRKIMELPLGFFSEERKGDIIARVSGDVNEIETSIMSSLDMLFKNPIMISIYLIAMLVISWQLTLFVFILLPVAGWAMGKVGKSLKRKSFLGQTQWGALISSIEETLSGLRVIKAFNAEKKVQERFASLNETFRRTTNRIYRRQQLAHPMSELLGTITIVIILWYGGTLILGNNSPIEASTFIYYLVIFYSIINPAKELSKAGYSIQKGLASVERIDKILMAKSDIVSPANPKPIVFEDAIEYRDVWFRYNSDWVIKGINLRIDKGQTVALVGQSGSGKSTLVDLLPRFYDIERGGITIDGTDIRDTSLYDLRSLMGNVNQDPILFNDSFFNNIAFGVATATQQEVEEAARIANAHDFIMATEAGYDTNIGDGGGKLSGGQRQRISIARAILKNPSVLILDEATSALDTESERLVQEALDNLMRNRTTIVIAHRLSTIRKADLICVLHEGEIVERGKHDNLIALNGYYKRLCDMQKF